MKMFIYSFAALVCLIVVVLVAFSIASRKQPELGLVDGQLRPCPATPNCVCSEYPGDSAYIEPLRHRGAAVDGWERLKVAVSETGGMVIREEPGYLRAVYKTPVLRFFDDVEFRQDNDQQVIHVRSASRVGRSDFGANRKRVETIRAAFSE